MQRTLGGDRIGSGNKMKVRLNHYERSTHNLSEKCTTSAGIGTCIPTYCVPALRGDKFEINVAAGVRTLPTMGAMFGSYKLQVDYYFCPARLYIGLLHNNPTKIGLEMNKIFAPMFIAGQSCSANENDQLIKFSTSSLLHYLGLSGVGNVRFNGIGTKNYLRQFNALPVLGYFDIVKNYYSNKQEECGYILSHNTGEIINIDNAVYTDENEVDHEVFVTKDGNNYSAEFPIKSDYAYIINGYGFKTDASNIYITLLDNNHQPLGNEPQYSNSLKIMTENGTFTIDDINIEDCGFFWTDDEINAKYFKIYMYGSSGEIDSDLRIVQYPLSNIDDMRMQLLSYHTKGAPYIINEFNKEPYKTIAEKQAGNYYANINKYALNGLAIKTYQADMYNAWLSTEYIDGINGIANITRVSTEGGGFTIDALNFNEKMYDLLNRIIVAGNTYEDWQDVVYEDLPKRHLESPMYLGGLSQEIVFEEIVSTAQTDSANLGKIGGRGISRHRKGGKIKFKCDEAGFIIAITSITPRLNYSQGNAFYFTDIQTMDDFHKPALDQIGFQDLIGERMAYFDTIVEQDSQITRHTIGKLPAWIEYMTAVDKVHGEMADGEVAYMVLNRNYTYSQDYRTIEDATTYIDPSKYNYAFAYDALDSQNFWLQIDNNVIARRKMSAKLMPNI